MATTVDLEDLTDIPLFRGLTPQQLSHIQDRLHTKTFPAGGQLMMAGLPGEAVYLIVNGTVRVQIERSDGRTVIVGIHGPGDIVGEMSVVDRDVRCASVVAQEETLTLWMDRATLQESLRTMPTMASNLMELLSRRLRRATSQIESLAALDAPGRIAHQILTLARTYGHTDSAGDIHIRIRLTQEDLADLVGCSRVRVNQILSAYKRRRVVSVDQNHRITVHDMRALERECE